MKCYIIYWCVVLMLGCFAHAKNDIEQSHDKVVVRAENLESEKVVGRAKNLESELIMILLSDVKELRTEIKEQKTQQERELGELKSLNEALSDDIAKLTENMKQLKEERNDKPKTVYAQIQARGRSFLFEGTKVKFNKIIANVGNAYKTAQDYFEAPYDGTYLFTASLCVESYSLAVFSILQDGINLATGKSGDVSQDSCGTATASTYMRAGMRIWVEVGFAAGIVGSWLKDKTGISSFTGVLINDFKKT